MTEDEQQQFRQLFAEGFEQIVLPHIERIDGRLETIDSCLETIEDRLGKIEQLRTKETERLDTYEAGLNILKKSVAA